MNASSSKNQDHLVVALIPAHNEAANIEHTVKQAAAFLPVWVVDDGSTDDTARVAEKAGATVLRQMPNQGKGAALRFGFSRAIQAGLRGVITLDGDGQHDPLEIPSFLAEIEEEPVDLVIGSRRFDQMPFPRKYSNAVGRELYNLALGRRIQDNQSGYRYISSRLMRDTLDCILTGFEFEVEMISICARTPGYVLKEVPIKTIYLQNGKSHIRYGKHIVGFFRLLWRTAKDRNKK